MNKILTEEQPMKEEKSINKWTKKYFLLHKTNTD